MTSLSLSPDLIAGLSITTPLYLNETYTSLVHYHKSIDKIIVSNLEYIKSCTY